MFPILLRITQTFSGKSRTVYFLIGLLFFCFPIRAEEGVIPATEPVPVVTESEPSSDEPPAPATSEPSGTPEDVPASAPSPEPISEPSSDEPPAPATSEPSGTPEDVPASAPSPEPISEPSSDESALPAPESETPPPALESTPQSTLSSEEIPATPPEDTDIITLIDTGDGIIGVERLLEMLGPLSDTFIEIETLIFDEEKETDQEIQNEPTIADNTADNTDEDPNVDLVDPSTIPDPPGAIPEIEPDLPPQDDTPVVESQGESQSTLALLDSLLEPEELFIRTYDKDIVIDRDATHTCRADIFRAVLQDTSSSRARVKLFQNKKKRLPSLLEIGALPAGLNVVFKSNEEYTYAPGTRETVIEFDITRQIGAGEGDFTIPIIYTLTGNVSSSVICQINIIND